MRIFGNKTQINMITFKDSCDEKIKGGIYMLKKIMKPITFIISLTMLISVFAVYPIMGSALTSDDDPTKYKKVKTTQGSVVIEAEDYVVDKNEANVIAVKEASKREHVKFMNANLTKPTADMPGFVGFELEFDKTGKYFMWFRYIAPGSDTVWLDYDAEEERTRERGYINAGFTLSSTDTEYLWKKVAIIQAQEGETIKVRLRTREGWFTLDKIIITDMASYTPKGVGKAPDPNAPFTPEKMPEDRYPIPTITPPPQHPKLFFKAEDIERIKTNMTHPEMAELVDEFNILKETSYTGELPSKDPNDDSKGLEIIASKAFDYAINGNTENAKQAISAIKNYARSLNVSATGDKSRQLGQTISYIAKVYDWCYPLLTSQDKAELLVLAQTLSTEMEVGFPPDLQTMICGHGAEYQLYRDWLAMAIACYDEYPDVYNMVAGKIFSADSVDYRNWWNQSGTHSQGSSYATQTRWKAEMQAHVLIKKMCGAELFNEEDLVKIAYESIYRRRPDGQIMIDGDDNNPNSNPYNTYVTGYGVSSKDAIFLAYVISGDPLFKKEFLYNGGFENEYSRESVQTVEKIILNDPNVKADVTAGTLPLTRYFGSPVGEMVARTGWDLGIKSNDVIATMKIGEYYGMNHDHYDSGHFMIYYKGILANDSGWYEMHGSDHQKNYMSQSIAHNTLVIETAYNKWGNQNQGMDGPDATDINTVKGRNFFWMPESWEEYQNDNQINVSEVIGYEFGPDLQYPEYSYLAGDLTNAYTSDYDDGVKEALRHMIFMPTGDDKNPAAFIVFDKIETKEGGMKKAFLLHSQEEPEVKGNVTTIKRVEKDYNGKLVNQTLLPKSANLAIEKIGGAEYDANGNLITETDKRFWNKEKSWMFIQDDIEAAKNANTTGRVVKMGNGLEAGWGRVEIMPKKSEELDYMLNVMYVGSADDDSALQKAELIETDAFVGAKIFDRVAMFNTAKERTNETVAFTIPGNETALKVNVAGLKAGTWSISANGSEIGTQIASEDGGMIYFTAPAGSVTLTYVSGDANKQFTKSAAPVLEGVTIFFNNNFLYSDVPPTIRDGRTLIPMRALLEAMDAEVSWDEATSTATAVASEGTEIKITENQKTVYVNGNAVELDVPAMIIDGRFVIPVRFVAENLGAKVSWDDLAQKVIITKQRVSQLDLGIRNYIPIKSAKQSGAENNPERQIQSSIDGNASSSYWGVSSDNHDAWGIYDFGEVKTLDKVMITFMHGNTRKYKFDIEVSVDGVNYTAILKDKETSGDYATGKFETFDLGGAQARYVRYRGYGNNTNKWNSLAEIVFTEKK